jgi:hypothetical protein
MEGVRGVLRRGGAGGAGGAGLASSGSGAGGAGPPFFPAGAGETAAAAATGSQSRVAAAAAATGSQSRVAAAAADFSGLPPSASSSSSLPSLSPLSTLWKSSAAPSAMSGKRAEKRSARVFFGFAFLSSFVMVVSSSTKQFCASSFPRTSSLYSMEYWVLSALDGCRKTFFTISKFMCLKNKSH